MFGKNKTILFLSHWSKFPGGAEYSLADILCETSKEHLVHLITTEKGYLTEKAKEAGAICHVAPTLFSLKAIKRDNLLLSLILNFPSLLSFISLLIKTQLLIFKIKPDCIHANIAKSHCLLFLLQVLGYKGKSIFHIREIFRKGTVSHFLYSIFLRNTNSEIIAISSSVKNALPDSVKNKAKVIYNGVFIAGQVPKKPKPFGFIYLGRVVPWKGCHLLIDAFYKLKCRSTTLDPKLTIAGGTYYWNSSYRQQLFDQVKRYGIEDSVTILEHQSSPFSILQKHHCFCSAAIEEPFGRSVAEAQGCALPVVAFSCSGTKEIVEHKITGLLVKKCDTDAFSKAMEHFLQNPKSAVRMGNSGYIRSRGLFNREIQVPILATAITTEKKRWPVLR
ncbi:glycosyltransferase family 4 protein [Chitinispirillales bacterium ANBcel5]|uniref:glycosyltransferase family 4 protein n=1 Tax=Cellulosispirillum alkaliphilum TaxID=3039283 RepID=UPI002A50052A|nr:glycosyltransferase family 4 protein [Chitinispirillales bacterium ANBcel5]